MRKLLTDKILLEFKNSFGNYHPVCPNNPYFYFFWDMLYLSDLVNNIFVYNIYYRPEVPFLLFSPNINFLKPGLVKLFLSFKKQT